MTAPLSLLEETKRHLDPFGNSDEVFARLAHGTAADISPADDIVMRWHGLYRQLPLEAEAFMLRLKLPEGAITAAQALVAAELAERVGDRRLSLTTRQGIEFHGLRLADLPSTFVTLNAVGLTTVGACGDQVRNVVGCPVAGIDPHELLDTSPLATTLTAAFLGNPQFANLPRKFKIALSGCACGCVPYDINDVGLVAARNAQGQLGYAVLIGGGLSVQPVHAVPFGVWLGEDEVDEVLTHLVEIFREHGNRENRGRARVKHLVAIQGVDWLREELQRRLGRPLTTYDHPIPAPARGDHLGVHRQREAGRVYLGIPVPAGILRSAQLRLLGEIAQQYGQRRLRLTHQQNIVLPDIAEAHLPAVLDQLVTAGLPVDAESKHGRTVVCVGKTYCTKAITHTKERLQPLVAAIEDPLLGTAVTLRVSGCPNGCGGHAIGDIGLRGASAKTEAGTEERFDVFAGGGETPGAPAFAQRILSRQRPDELATAITALLQRYRAEAVDDETFSAYAQRVLWTNAE